MQNGYDDLRAAGAGVVAISSSSVENHRRLAAKIGAEFPILSDPEGKTIREYGLFHPGALPVVDIPVSRPAELLLDREGIIRERHLTENWRVRARLQTFLTMLDRLSG